MSARYSCSHPSRVRLVFFSSLVFSRPSLSLRDLGQKLAVSTGRNLEIQSQTQRCNIRLVCLDRPRDIHRLGQTVLLIAILQRFASSFFCGILHNPHFLRCRQGFKYHCTSFCNVATNIIFPRNRNIHIYIYIHTTFCSFHFSSTPSQLAFSFMIRINPSSSL